MNVEVRDLLISKLETAIEVCTWLLRHPTALNQRDCATVRDARTMALNTLDLAILERDKELRLKPPNTPRPNDADDIPF